MEPQWSVAEEQQSIGRATRMGSYTDVPPIVHLYRWIATSPAKTKTADEKMQVTRDQK